MSKREFMKPDLPAKGSGYFGLAAISSTSPKMEPDSSMNLRVDVGYWSGRLSGYVRD